jgi:hypothetical protein
VDQDHKCGGAAGAQGLAGMARGRDAGSSTVIWHCMCQPQLNSTAHLSARILQVFQEVVSYIKGTAEAISSDSGLLTLSQYLEVLRPTSAAHQPHLLPTLQPSRTVTLVRAYQTLISAPVCLQVGRKRAPNFSSDMRRRVYPVFLKYEKLKVRAHTPTRAAAPELQHACHKMAHWRGRSHTLLTFNVSPRLPDKHC